MGTRYTKYSSNGPSSLSDKDLDDWHRIIGYRGRHFGPVEWYHADYHELKSPKILPGRAIYRGSELRAYILRDENGDFYHLNPEEARELSTLEKIAWSEERHAKKARKNSSDLLERYLTTSERTFLGPEYLLQELKHTRHGFFAGLTESEIGPLWLIRWPDARIQLARRVRDRFVYTNYISGMGEKLFSVAGTGTPCAFSTLEMIAWLEERQAKKNSGFVFPDSEKLTKSAISRALRRRHRYLCTIDDPRPYVNKHKKEIVLGRHITYSKSPSDEIGDYECIAYVDKEAVIGYLSCDFSEELGTLETIAWLEERHAKKNSGLPVPVQLLDDQLRDAVNTKATQVVKIHPPDVYRINNGYLRRTLVGREVDLIGGWPTKDVKWTSVYFWQKDHGYMVTSVKGCTPLSTLEKLAWLEEQHEKAARRKAQSAASRERRKARKNGSLEDLTPDLLKDAELRELVNGAYGPDAKAVWPLRQPVWLYEYAGSIWFGRKVGYIVFLATSTNYTFEHYQLVRPLSTLEVIAWMEERPAKRNRA